MPPLIEKEVVVCGAGVIGLQAALTLLEEGFRVTIVAKHWPGEKDIEYTSPWAGAHYRSYAAPDDLQFQKYELETYKYWLELLKKDGAECGLSILPDTYHWDCAKHGTIEGLWWRTHVPNFIVHEKSKLLPSTELAVTYDSFCINVPRYLDYLISRVGELGVKTITAEVDLLEEIFELPGIQELDVIGIVNCTGMGARGLVPDDKVYPTKGQTVLVKGEAKQITFREGNDYVAYVIPRVGSGSTVLGGNQGVNDWSPKPDDELTNKILQRCKVLAPELLNKHGEFDVMEVCVGRRPTREGGVRIELVEYDGGKFICHCYGHGGAGYQTSVGSAREVCRLVKEFVERKG
ncbi:hypothetical protein BDZ91DRAFT_779327 [Kalaharituber pfeilii]|nr:hypothetical protein BDZ91DRAFT_779327 [Kalaharituber pfeilii]